MAGEQTPAGWYADPEGSGNQRYWDGTQWTEQRQPAPSTAPPAAAAPWGAEPQKKKGKGRGCLTALGIVVALLIATVAIAAIAGGGDDDTTTGSTKTESNSDKKSEADEVKVTSCSPPDAIGVVYVNGTAENTSSKQSDYIIEVAVIAPDGTQIGTGTTIAENVEPDQKAVWKALTDTSSDNWKAGSTCKVVDVDRNASL